MSDPPAGCAAWRPGPYGHRGRRHRLANTAYAAARYNITTLRRHHFGVPHIWLDIEPTAIGPWHRRADNRLVIRAWVRAYRRVGYAVGFYSTQSLWQGIAGRMRLDLPEWRTAGPASARAALGMCRRDRFQGGRAVLAQWWTPAHDYDRICPGLHGNRVMARYFVNY